MSEQHARSKVTARHLTRDAYLYIRQSSLRQVIENTESTQRQYALRQRAVALGGQRIGSSSSIPIWDNQALPQSSASVFSDSSLTSGWAVPGSFLAWRYRDWRATLPTGTACSRSAREERRTQAQLVSEIDELLTEHHDAEVAKILVERERKPGGGGIFDVAHVAFIRTTYNLKSFRERLLENGYVSIDKLATRFDVTHGAIKRWRVRGLLRGRRVNEKEEYVYEDPENDPRVWKAAQHAARVRPVAPGSARTFAAALPNDGAPWSWRVL